MNGSKAFLITNNADNHSPEDWAVATADRLIHVGPESEHKLAALKLEIAVIEILTKHHNEVQDKEKGLLVELGQNHVETPIDPTGCAFAALDEIVDVAKGTVFEAHWAKEEVQKQMFDIIANDFAVSAKHEREAHVRAQAA